MTSTSLHVLSGQHCSAENFPTFSPVRLFNSETVFSFGRRFQKLRASLPKLTGADLELGAKSGSLGDGSPPVGSSGEAPAGSLGRESPEAGAFFKSTQLEI